MMVTNKRTLTKKLYKLIFISLIINLFIISSSTAQINKSKMSFVDNKCPDFKFVNIDYFSKPNASLDDFKGKWLIIDFWSQYCGSCVNSMPKMNALQEEFGDRLKIVMVGIFGQTKASTVTTTKTLYEKIRKQTGLKLTVAYDTAFAKAVQVERLPDILVIDPNGVIRVRANEINSLQVDRIIKGDASTIQKEIYPYSETIKNSPRYDRTKPFLTDGNGGNGSNFFYRSLVSRADANLGPHGNVIDNGRIELLMMPLKSLYMYAFIGTNVLADNKNLYEKIFRNVILECTDSSYFYNENGAEKSYNYSLVYPLKALQDEINHHLIEDQEVLRIMQKDLEIAFPYKAGLEMRNKPFYKLVANKTAIEKLRTKGENPQSKKPWGPYRGAVYKNVSISSVVNFFMHNSYGYNWKVPIIDGSGISEKIDIEIKGFTFQEQLESLHKYGLDLVLDEKPMQCLVIRDRE
ncbi:MAG: TlpA family protein disulfide reductase [Heyndrickxia sp.]